MHVFCLIALLVRFSNGAAAEPCPQEHLKPILSTEESQRTGVQVCGIAETNRDGKPAAGAHRVTAFEIRRSASVFLKNDSELESFEISVDLKKGSLIVDDLLWNQKFYPVTRRILSCASGKCKVSSPKCMLQLPRNPYPGVVDAIRKQAPAPSGTYDTLIANAAFQALTGDSEALALFDTKDWSYMNLDGASAEEFYTGREWIRKAREAGCLTKK